LVALQADDSPPVDSADSAADDSAAPDSSCQDAHWVLAGCPDDSPADLQAVDSLAYQVWHLAGFQAGCLGGPYSAAPVFLEALF
jgi:hypothetical protein